MGMTKVPVVLQMEAVECGAASLAMILAYYGKIVPLEEIRIECGISRDGSKASNILKAARRYGMEAKGYRMEPEQLMKMTFPVILFWNFNHFVVLKGFKGNKVYINDPATGSIVISYEEFDKSFTGIVLTFIPERNFKKGGEKPSSITGVKKRLEGNYSVVVYITIAGLFLVVPGLVIPTFSKIFVDNILVKQMHGWMKPLLVAMFVTALIKGALTWLQQKYLLKFETKLALESSAKFFLHVLKLPVNFFFQRQVGELTNRIQLNDKVAQLLSQDISVNFLNLIMVVFYSFLMFQYDVFLTVAGVLTALLNIFVLKIVASRRVDLNQRLLQEKGKLLGTAMTGLQLIESLKATGSESDFFATWSGHHAKVLNAQQKMGNSNIILSNVPVFLTGLNNIAVLTIGSLKVMNGELTMGMLVAFQTLMSSFLMPVSELMNLGGKLQEAFGDFNRLDDVMRYKRENIFNEMDIVEYDQKNKLECCLEIVNVSFGYNKLEPPLIENFNLKLNPGEKIALVGDSGSGKSTVAKLVAGLYMPWKGEILYDGKKISEYPREIINNSIAMVDQDIFLFEGSIRENITMWDSTIEEKKFIRAAEDACIHDIITERSGAYDGCVNEGGSNFSGGERQRLEIARALAINPTLLILDEATSALDSLTEKIINENIDRRGCSCLIIAHRLSTIRDADKIIVLEKGKIVQKGTHEELIQDEKGLYYKLVNN